MSYDPNHKMRPITHDETPSECITCPATATHVCQECGDPVCEECRPDHEAGHVADWKAEREQPWAPRGI